MDNYPDDIRQYDSDPRSPFYEEPWPQCEMCEEYFNPDTGSAKYCDNCLEQIEDDRIEDERLMQDE